jgi:hypothetical protein
MSESNNNNISPEGNNNENYRISDPFDDIEYQKENLYQGNYNANTGSGNQYNIEKVKANRDVYLGNTFITHNNTESDNYRSQETEIEYTRYYRRVEQMINYYKKFFGGRKAELKTLDEFLQQQEKPFALLLAPAGRGKSALAIHWVEKVKLAQEWKVIFVPISRQYNTATETAALYLLVHELASFYGEHNKIKLISHSPEQLRPLVMEYLQRKPLGGRRLLVVLDGLDNVVGWKVDFELFPSSIGPHLKILALARELGNKRREQWLIELGWQEELTYQLQLPFLNREEIEDILRSQSTFQSVDGSETSLLNELHRISGGDPLHVRFLIEDLQRGSTSLEQLNHLPSGLETYLENWYKELEASLDEKDSVLHLTINTLLKLCAVSKGPLSSEDLNLLDPDIFKEKSTLLEAVNKVSRFIMGNGSEEGGFIFTNTKLKYYFLKNKLFEQERAIFERKFVEYGLKWYSFRKNMPSNYLRQYWIVHLKEANEWTVLQKVLTEVELVEGKAEQPWATARFIAEGSYTGYLSDLEILWQHAEKQHDLGLGLRCALITSSIRSLSINLWPELLAYLVKVGTLEGHWNEAAALEHIRQMQQPMQAVTAIRSLLFNGCSLPYNLALDVILNLDNEEGWQAIALMDMASYLPKDEQPEFYRKTLSAVEAITNESNRVKALIDLAPNLPKQFTNPLLDVVKGIKNEWHRARALIELTPHLGHLSKEIVDITRDIKNEWHKAQAIIGLASNLPQFLPELLKIGEDIALEEARSRAISCLIPHLPADLLPQALDIALRLESEAWRSQLLSDLALWMPEQELPKMLVATQKIITENWRAKVLFLLALRFKGEEQVGLFSVAFNTSKAINNDGWKTQLLISITDKIPQNLFPELLQVIQTLKDESCVAQVLIKLAEQPQTPLHLILEIAQNIEDEGWRARVLTSLIPHLTGEMPGEMLKIVRNYKNRKWQSHLLTELAPYLSDELFSESLDLALNITNDLARAKAITGLIPYTGSGLISKAFQAALGIVDEYWRHKAFIALVPLAQPEQLKDIIEAINSFERLRWQAEVFTKIADHLPDDKKKEIYQKAIISIQNISNEQQKAVALSWLAENLPKDFLPQLLEAAFTIENENWSAQALIWLSKYGQTSFVPRVIEALQGGIDNEYWRIQVFIAYAHLLPSKTYITALELVHSITNEAWKVEALICLASQSNKSGDLLVQILELAQTIENENWRSKIFAALAQSTTLTQADLSKALKVAQVIADDECLASILIAMVQVPFSSSIVADLLEVTLKIKSEVWRARALTGLADYLPEDLLVKVWEITDTIVNADSRFAIFAALAPHLSPELISATLQKVQEISSERQRSQALVRLAPYISNETLPVALNIARKITNDRWCAKAFIALIPRLEGQEVLIFKTLIAIREIKNESWRARLVITLTPYLMEDLLEYCLEVIQLIENEEVKSRAIVEMVNYLPDSLIPIVWKICLTIYDEILQAKLLEAVAKRLPFDLLVKAWNRLDTFSVEEKQAKAVKAIVPYLPNELLKSAWQKTRSLHDEWLRAEAVIAFIPRLPSELIPDILEIAEETSNPSWRAELLHAVVPSLPERLLPKILRILQSIDAGLLRGKVLVTLAKSKPGEYTFEILESARTIQNEKQRAKVLGYLVEWLPTSTYTQVLEEARQLNELNSKAELLINLALNMQGEQQKAIYSEILKVITQIAEPSLRSQISLMLLDNVPLSWIDKILEIVKGLGDENWQAQTLSKMVEKLPQELLSNVLKIIKGFSNENFQMKVLITLVSRLTDEELTEALDFVRTIKEDKYLRFIGLTSLGPYLPAEQQTRLYLEALSLSYLLDDKNLHSRALNNLRVAMSNFRGTTFLDLDNLALWKTSLRKIVSYGRPKLLRQLAELMPLLAVIATPQALKEFSEALADVISCWP